MPSWLRRFRKGIAAVRLPEELVNTWDAVLSSRGVTVRITQSGIGGATPRGDSIHFRQGYLGLSDNHVEARSDWDCAEQAFVLAIVFCDPERTKPRVQSAIEILTEAGAIQIQ